MIRSFLPSLPGRRRDADHGIKSPPDTPNVGVLEELMKGDYHREALLAPQRCAAKLLVVKY